MGTAAGQHLHALDLNGLSGGMTAYTPAVTNLTLGAGTIVGRYLLRGTLCNVNVLLTFGAGTTIGNRPLFGLPFAAAFAASCDGSFDVIGVHEYPLLGTIYAGVNQVRLTHVLTGGLGDIGPTTPVAIGSGDKIGFSAMYEIVT